MVAETGTTALRTRSRRGLICVLCCHVRAASLSLFYRLLIRDCIPYSVPPRPFALVSFLERIPFSPHPCSAQPKSRLTFLSTRVLLLAKPLNPIAEVLAVPVSLAAMSFDPKRVDLGMLVSFVRWSVPPKRSPPSPPPRTEANTAAAALPPVTRISFPFLFGLCLRSRLRYARCRLSGVDVRRVVGGVRVRMNGEIKGRGGGVLGDGVGRRG